MKRNILLPTMIRGVQSSSPRRTNVAGGRPVSDEPVGCRIVMQRPDT
jgi:hypothetical protein